MPWTQESADAIAEALEKCARRYHQQRQVENAREHKFWKFENCPAEGCSSARKALGMPTVTMPPLAHSDSPANREPGQDG